MQLSLPPALHGLLKERHLIHLLCGNQQIDSRDVHVHHPPGAYIQVANLAVTHLSFRQTYSGARGLDQGVRKFSNEFVIGGLPGKGDRIAPGFDAVAPSIQNGKHYRFRSFCHGSTEYT